MSLTVYTISGAPRPWRVPVGLAHKGLDYEIQNLEASGRESIAILAWLGFENMLDRYPNLFAWMNRLESIDGMKKTLPYHW